MSIAARVEEIRESIKKNNNNNSVTGGVTLLAASKAQPVSAIEEAIAAGIRDFGENRVQEAADKWPPLKGKYPEVRLHLIGPLQTNKVKQALELFDVIQTVDRPKLAQALAEDMARNGKRLPCYIQVNIGEEAQKAGVMPQEADTFIDYCRKDLGLTIEGLMCIPPHHLPPAPFFAMLNTIARRNGLTGLSMGMSDDYEQAVRMGSSCIRLGRSLFGERL